MPAFSNSSGLKSVFQQLRFRDGLVWMVGLTVENTRRFQISAAQCSISCQPCLHSAFECESDRSGF